MPRKPFPHSSSTPGKSQAPDRPPLIFDIFSSPVFSTPRKRFCQPQTPEFHRFIEVMPLTSPDEKAGVSGDSAGPGARHSRKICPPCIAVPPVAFGLTHAIQTVAFYRALSITGFVSSDVSMRAHLYISILHKTVSPPLN